jgi:hypothetical protein
MLKIQIQKNDSGETFNLSYQSKESKLTVIQALKKIIGELYEVSTNNTTSDTTKP